MRAAGRELSSKTSSFLERKKEARFRVRGKNLVDERIAKRAEKVHALVLQGRRGKKKEEPNRSPRTSNYTAKKSPALTERGKKKKGYLRKRGGDVRDMAAGRRKKELHSCPSGKKKGRPSFPSSYELPSRARRRRKKGEALCSTSIRVKKGEQVAQEKIDRCDPSES